MGRRVALWLTSAAVVVVGFVACTDQRPEAGSVTPVLVSGGGLSTENSARRCAWERLPTPKLDAIVESDLNAVVVASPTAAWAVGHRTDPFQAFSLRWNGQSWADERLAQRGKIELKGVAAVSSRQAWAVGEEIDANVNHRSVVLRWKDGRWSRIAAPDDSTRDDFMFQTPLQDVVAFGPDIAWAGGSLLSHWNGRRWSVARNVVHESILDLDGSSPDNVWAVGGNAARRPFVLHWNGTRWSKIKTPHTPLPDAEVESVAALRPNDVWISGYSAAREGSNDPRWRPFLMHWNGSRWSVNERTSARVGAESVMLARSTQDIWYYGDKALAHWNGRSWHVSRPSVLYGSGSERFFLKVTALSAAPGSSLWAVGYEMREYPKPTRAFVARRICR